MDQSRPRPRHDAAAQARPLIIERPDLAHPLRRGLSFALTVLAWAAWIAMWIPVLGVIAAWMGAPLERGAYPSRESVLALREMVALFPVALAGVIALLLANGLVGIVFRRMAPPPPKRFIGMEQLANSMALDSGRLAAWQSARILRVEHGPLGRVIDASVIR